MTKPDLMAKLAAYELVMVSGVSPQNNVSYGFFRNAAQAGAVGMLLIEADRRDNPEWTDFKVTRHAEIAAAVRDAKRWRYVVENSEWIRDEEDTLMAVRFEDARPNLESIGMRTDAIDTAMRAGEGEG